MKRNSLFFGCILGILPPLIAHLLMVFTALRLGNQVLSLYVIAALINLLFIRFFYQKALERSARGVILITFVAVLLLIFVEKLSLV